MKTYANTSKLAFLITVVFALVGVSPAFGQASVTTDQPDYPPGSTATITGAGFAPGETVQLQVANLTNPAEDAEYSEYQPWPAVADANGNFTTTWNVTEHEANMTLQLTATGLTSGEVAREVFTDKSASSGQGSCTPTPSSVTAGSAVNNIGFLFTWTDSYQGGSLATMVVPAGWTTPQKTSSSSAGYMFISGGNGSETIASITGTGPWTVTVNLSGNSPASFTLNYTNVTAPPSAGSSTFTMATEAAGAGGFVNLTGTQPVVTVNAGTATRMIVTLPGQTFTSGSGNSGTVTAQTAGTPFNLANLTAVDNYNNIVTSYSGAKTITYSGPANSPSGSAPTYTTAVSFTSGQSTTALATTLKDAQTTTITATDGSLTGVASSSLTVNPTTANKLAFSPSPAGAVYKTAFTTQPVVKTQDAYGNNSTIGLGGTVTVNLTLSTGTGPLMGTTSFNVGTTGGNGTATFSGLQINKAENGDVLTAAATSFASGTSSAFNVTVATVTPTVTLNSRVYDGTTTAATIASRFLSGVLGGDDVNLGTSGTVALFSSKNLGGYTPNVTGLGLSGTTAGNYQLSTTTVSPGASITALAVTLSGTRSYDGTAAAAAGILTIGNNFDGANLTLSGSVTLTSANAGSPNISSFSGLTLGGSAAGNYTLTGASGSVTIAKATPTVVVTPYTVTYDGSAHTATVTSITGVNNETGATVGTVTLPTAQTAAGTYSSDTWSFTGTANYNNIGSTTITDTINKRALTFTGGKTYDGSASATAAQLAFGNNVDGVNLTMSGSATLASANAGSPNISSFSGLTLGGSAAGNYTLTGASGSVTIAKTTPSVTVTVGTYTYNGLAQGPSSIQTISPADSGSVTWSYVGTGGTSYTASSTPPTAAGTYNATATVAADSNNNQASSSPTAFTIAKATPTVVVTPYTVTYDGSAHTATVTSITGVNGETGATVGTVTLSTTHTLAGTYGSDTWSLTGTANYNSIGSTTITDIINKRALTFTGGKTYDGSASATAAQLAFGNNVDGVNLTMSGSATLASANAGSPNISSFSGLTLGGSEADNYTLTGASGSVTIAKATASVVVTPYTVTYDGSAHTATVTSITGVNGETGATVGTVTLSTTHTLVGTYGSDNWSLTGTANYNSIGSTTITDTINKGVSTISQSGTSFNYNAAGQTPAISFSGSTGTQTTTYVGTSIGYASVNAPTNAGSYYVSNTVAADSNYNGATNFLAFTIGKTNLTITAQANTKVYDGTTVSATNAQITAGGIQGGDVAPTWTQIYADKNAGTGKTLTPASLVVADGNSGNNYNYTYSATNAGVITKATTTATVAVANSPVTYDGTGKAATVSITASNTPGGLQNILTGGQTLQTNAGAYAVAADYVPTDTNYTTLSGLAATSYFIIGKGASTIVQSGTDFLYNATGQSPDISFSGSTGAQTTNYVGVSINYADVVPPTNAGTYYLSNTLAADANYNSATNVIAFTIGATNLTLTPGANVKSYDGTTSATNVPTAIGLQGSDTVSGMTVVYDNATPGTGKTLSITAYTVNDGNGGNNYAVTVNTSADGVISAGDSAIVQSGTNFLYNATGQSPAISFSGSTGAQTTNYVGVNINYADVVAPTNAGTYYLSNTVAADANYNGATNVLVFAIGATNLTLTPGANVKSYDGTTSATNVPTATGLQGSDTVSGMTVVYDNATPGTGKTLSITAYTVNDGNGGNNYAVTANTSAGGVITAATLANMLVSSENSAGYQDPVMFTNTLNPDATGYVVFSANGVLWSSNNLSGGVVVSLSITNLPRGTNLITATYGGDNTYLADAVSLNQVVTNHPPVTGVMNVARTAGLKLRIKFADMTNYWSDADGDTVSLASISMATTNSVNLLTNGVQIIYPTNSPNVNDQITYTVSDGYGGTATGIINVVVNPFVAGQQTAPALAVSNNTLTTTFYGMPGYVYEVQRSTNLSAGLGWVDIATNTVDGTGRIDAADNFSDLGGQIPVSAYYRLKWQP